jgi:hypothetical protein
MIVIKLQGGLGNQMFQYAFARSLSVDTNIPFTIDITELEAGKDFIKERRYALSVFNIKPSILSRVKYYYFTLDKKYPRIASLGRKFRISIPKIVKQSSDLSIFDPLPWIKDDVYLDGFYQSEKYFLENQQTIKDDFKFKIQLGNCAQKVINEITKTESVILQIRRGDYATNPKTQVHFGLTSKEYFEESIKYIESRGVNNIKLFIISDDIEWCKQNLSFSYPTQFVSGPDIKDYEEIFIMNNAKHLVISNSTFGWWGAWLNNNKNKIVIAPKEWFKNKNLKQDDIVPPSWIRI